MTSEALTIQTESPAIVLRELASELDDQALHAAVIENPDYSDNYGNTMIKSLGTIEKVKTKRLGSTDALRMGIWEHNEFAGLITATPDEEKPIAEIGLFVRQQASGRGIGTLAIQTFTPVAIATFGQVYANVDADNRASARAFEKACYVETDLVRTDDGLTRVFEPERLLVELRRST